MSEYNWGRFIECKSGAVSGVCTSGGNRDCGGYCHKIYCNTNMHVDKKHCTYVTQSGWHDTISCPNGYVMVGRAASGGNRDVRYHGRSYVTMMKCCKAITSRLYK